MSAPPANDLARAIASLRGAVAELSPAGGDQPPPISSGESPRQSEIQQSTPEAYHDAASAPLVSVEPPAAPEAPAPAGGRKDKTAAARKARWKRRRAEGACWIAYEIDADWIDALVASGELPEANRNNREDIAAVLLDLAGEGIRARYGTVVSSRASLSCSGTRSAR